MTHMIQPSQGLGPTQAVKIDGWSTRSGRRRLIGEDVHIWILSRNLFNGKINQFHSYLSLWEQKKTMSLQYAKDRDDFVLGRGALRLLLSQYHGAHPREIEICNNRFGKPLLGDGRSGLNFNVAQSGNSQVFSLVKRRRIGIDIELIDHDVKMNDLMKEYFSVSEIREIQAQPSYMRTYAFFKTWTQKEALIKACGLGYELSSKSFCVDTNPKRQSQLIASGVDSTNGFQMYQIPITKSFSCSVAIEAPKVSHIRIFKMS